MKNRSILAACLMSTVTVPAIAADDVAVPDVTVPMALVTDDVTVIDTEVGWDEVTVLAGSTQPHGPSYDCGTAQGVVELVVCSDPVLSRLDLEVATLLGRAGKLGQRRWPRAHSDECNLDFDFHSGIGARYEAVPCLITDYVKQLVALESEMHDEPTGRRVLDVLADVGILALNDMTLDLGSVRIDLPRVVPVTRIGTAWPVASPFDDARIDHPGEVPVTSVGTPAPAMAHPACIEALLRANVPSSIRRDACRAGTDHLPFALETLSLYEEGQEYVTYVPWHPSGWEQRQGDRFGYRVVGALDDGRTLIHVHEEYTGASGTNVATPLAVVRGLRTGETIEVEQEIYDAGLTGFCWGDIDEVDIANPDTLRLVSAIPAETLATLFDQFPEQLHGVTESERRRLRTLEDSGELSVAMSSMAITCFGRAHYDHAIETGRRTLTGVSMEVTQADRADAESSPALACLFDLLLEEGRPEMPAMYRPMQIQELLADFIDRCEGLRSRLDFLLEPTASDS